MKHEHLMKFRIRQMEKETKTIKRKKNPLQNLIGNLYKALGVRNRSNLTVKGNVDHDYN